MDIPEPIQQLATMSDEMGVSLFQRFSEADASCFLHINLESLKRLRENGKLAFFQVDENNIEFFGYHLLEYLISTISQPAIKNSQPSYPDRIIRAKEISETTGLSRTTIWRLEKKGDFPDRVQLGTGSVGWKLSDVNKWIHSRKKTY